MLKTAGGSGIKVTIICLAYNHEKYIRHTLEGFVKQKTDFKFEVLVHDDASTDGTANVIKEYEDKYPDIIKATYQMENQYSKHINISQTFLYPKAQGEYFAFCEGDDYWCDENKLQKQYDILQKHSDCSMCVCQACCINEDGSINQRLIPEKNRRIRGGYYSQDDMARILWGRNGGLIFQTSTYFLRRSAINDLELGKFPSTGYLNGDECIFRCALSAGNFYYIDEIMSCRRLMSVGSWSERFVSKSEKEKQEFYMRNIKGDIIYDEYSDGRFHKFIFHCVANRLCAIGQSNPEYMRQEIEKLGFKEKDVMKNCSAKNKILYRIARISPALFELLVDWRYKIFPN